MPYVLEKSLNNYQTHEHPRDKEDVQKIPFCDVVQSKN